ncbi:MAG: 7TM diverse intracellular signaling domain-containing protein [Crocinitomicaceae bacterium]
MKKLLLFLFVFLLGFLYAQNGEIVLTKERMGSSFSKDVLYYKDAEKALSLEGLLQLADSSFSSLKDDIPNMDFTSARFWVKFKITNRTDESYFILETARPITNRVKFYQIRGTKVENQFKSGDDYHYSEKVIPHRKNLFPVSIEPGETKKYVIELESDGEVLLLPIKIYDKISFFEGDYTHQFGFGFYYGLMSLVIIIYFFFFVLLKDNAFLFYILYVFSQALLQFTLDGFSFHHFFPSGGYMANHFVLIIAGITVIILLKYVDLFLHLRKNSPGMLKIFRGCQILVGATVLMSLFPGKPYEISYPIINGVSLISIVLSVFAIYKLKFKGIHVDFYFTVAFTILITGAVIFILGNFNIVGDAEMAQAALKISSALEVAILSISMSNKYRRLQKEKEVAQEAAVQSLKEKNALMDDINVKLEHQVRERTSEIEKQKEELAAINEEILSSIFYAKRIQEAILPSAEHVQRVLPESFVFYRPKDVVSGDFYFVEETTRSTDSAKLKVFAAVDCTGHGVPGAFMSIVGSNYLTRTLTEPKVNSVSEALEFLNKGVVNTLRQNKVSADVTVRDGMDLSLCALDHNKGRLYFAGAKNPVYIIRRTEGEEDPGFDMDEDKSSVFKSEQDENLYLFEVKGDTHPIGAYLGEELKPFTTHLIHVKKGDMIYLFSDGFADQFGGPSGKKYKYKTFKKFLLSIAHLGMEQQKTKLVQEYDGWKGELEQIDDVLVMGVRV